MDPEDKEDALAVAAAAWKDAAGAPLLTDTGAAVALVAPGRRDRPPALGGCVGVWQSSFRAGYLQSVDA